MATYAWTVYNVNLTFGNPYVRIMGANPRRLTLLVSSVVNAFPCLSDIQIPSTSSGWGSFQAIIGGVVTYRDYGPLMQSEIWAANFGTSGIVTFTEIFRATC